MKNFKTLKRNFFEFSIVRFLSETLPISIMFALIWLMFHKTEIDFGHVSNPEIGIHFTTEIIIALFYHIFSESMLHSKGYLFNETRIEKAANYFSMLIHYTAIIVIALLYLFECKTGLMY